MAFCEKNRPIEEYTLELFNKYDNENFRKRNPLTSQS